MSKGSKLLGAGRKGFSKINLGSKSKSWENGPNGIKGLGVKKHGK